MNALAESVVVLAAAVAVVPLFKRFRLGAVLGFLAAGLVIGPWGLRFVTEVETIRGFGELGVVLLLFIIGLELRFSRLWALRKSIFGIGGTQVLITSLAIAVVALAFGQHWQAAIVIGVALSMNSTAFILQLLAERKQLTMQHGRSAFAISLFQDIAVIPMLAFVPLLAAGVAAMQGSAWIGALEAVAAIAIIIVGGHYALRPVFRVIANSGIQEIFTGAALLVVLGTALLTSSIGLSMTLGAFLAGVVLADSEYRHEIEASIEPFKGLLLGLFFISVGMGANLGLFRSHALVLIASAIALMALKALLLYTIGRMSKHNDHDSRRLAALLCHAGEFAFVLFAVAQQAQVIDAGIIDFLVVMVTLTMALTPIVYLTNERAIDKHMQESEGKKPFDVLPDDSDAHIIIAGFGRVGQIVGRILEARGIRFTALDINADHIESVRRFGRTAYFGDASKLDLLRAAKTDQAKVFVLAIDDPESSVRTAQLVRKHFPKAAIIARARNRFHAHKLMEVGVDAMRRETIASSLELAAETLTALGYAEADVSDTVAKFRKHDEAVLERQFAVHTDETKLVQTSKEAAQELAEILHSDRTDDAQDRAADMTQLARNWR